MRRSTRWALVLIAAALSAALPTGARAAETLAVDISPLAPRSRSCAPIEVLATFDLAGKSLLAGELELILHEDGNPLYVYRSAPLALVGGEQRYRLTLPTVTLQPYGAGTLEAYWRDTRTGGRERLGTYGLPAVSAYQRSGVLCVSDPWRGSLPRYGEITGALRLELLQPGERTRDLLSTFPARLGTESLPRHALGYCAFDLVVLIGEGLDLLERSQLEAIIAWVGAGGSVFVAPSANPTPVHRQFLEGLRTGRAAQPAQRQEASEYYRLGLGRVVIDTRPITEITETLETESWRDVLAFLWKLTDGQRQYVAANGTWRLNVPAPRERQSGYGQYEAPNAAEDLVSYNLQPIPQGQELVASLMPRDLRLIPFSVIVLILVVYLLLIGPVDYFALGLLRRRKFTWVLFPLVTAAVTLATVRMCNAYLGRTDHRRAWSVVDVGAGGQVLRENRFEMLFAGAQATAETDARNAIVTPMDHRSFGAEYMYGQGRYRGGYMSGHGQIAAPSIYSGPFPRRFRMTQQVLQWTPQLNRTLRIDPGEAPLHGLELNWDAVDPAAFATDYGRRSIVGQLVGEGTFSGSIGLMNLESCYPLRGNPWSIDSRTAAHTRFAVRGNYGQRSGQERLLTQVCRRRTGGFSSIVAQISPTGGGNFEDLTILDPTDPNQWLLVVVAPIGADVVVYRRLYFGDR